MAAADVANPAWDVLKLFISAGLGGAVGTVITMSVARYQLNVQRDDECVAHLDECALKAEQAFRRRGQQVANPHAVDHEDAIEEMHQARSKLGRDITRRFSNSAHWHGLQVALTKFTVLIETVDPTNRTPLQPADVPQALTDLRERQTECMRAAVRCAKPSFMAGIAYSIWGKFSKR